MQSARWATHKSVDIHDAYAAVHQKLSVVYDKKDVDLCMTYFWNFVCVFNEPEASKNSPLEDPRTLSATREGCENARRAWESMVERFRLAGAYMQRVRSQLCRALIVHVPGLANLINPALRMNERSTKLTAVRSWEHDFTVYDCLPLAVKKLPSNNTRLRLLTSICEELVHHLRSVSRSHLQKSLLFYDKLLHGREGNNPVYGGDDQDYNSAFSFVRRLTAEDWLRLYGTVYDGERGCICAALFLEHIRLLQKLHRNVLNPKDGVSIPTPSSATCSEAHNRAGQGNHSSASEGGSFGSSGSSSEEDERLRARWRRLRETVADLRGRLVKSVCVEPSDSCEFDFAFRPDEVRRMVVAASTTVERLMLLLFLSTGLRRGGLTRLKLGGDGYKTGADVPKRASTVEKGNKTRVIVLTPSCRILVARWYREERRAKEGGSVPNRYLFPSPRKVGCPISRGFVNELFDKLFKKANVQGPHAHPHTFRHTLVLMMFMAGNSFEKISKYIGHSSPDITSKVYGRLKFSDMMGSIQGMPFLGEGECNDTKPEWHALSKYLRDPWKASDEEWIGLEGDSTAAPEAELKRKALKEASRADKIRRE